MRSAISIWGFTSKSVYYPRNPHWGFGFLELAVWWIAHIVQYLATDLPRWLLVWGGGVPETIRKHLCYFVFHRVAWSCSYVFSCYFAICRTLIISDQSPRAVIPLIVVQIHTPLHSLV